MELDPLIVKLILDSTGYKSGLSSAQKETGTTGASITKTLNGVGLGGVASFATITGAIIGTIKVLKECYNTTMDYLETIKQMSLLNGTTIEETARLISVSGRYQVSQQQLDLASRTLANNGLSLTIDTLATLADQYHALSSADEQQAFLMANFGARGGTAFVEMINAGGQAIRDQAAATRDGLIPSGEMLNMQENQKNAVYDMSQAWKVFELQIGEEILPGLTDLVKGLTPVVDALHYVIKALEIVYKYGTSTGLAETMSGWVTGAVQNSRMKNTPKSPDERGLAGGTQGWQTVPAGFPGDSFKVGLSSGETYAVNAASGGSNAGIDYRKLARAIRDALNG
jgi:hypothetical protein